MGLRWFVIGVLSLKGEALGVENWLDFPHLPSRGGDTRIFWTRIHLTQRMRLPLKESRMKFGEPTELRRKSGVRGTRFASLITGKDRSLEQSPSCSSWCFYLGGLFSGVSGLPSTLWTPVFVVWAVLW